MRITIIVIMIIAISLVTLLIFYDINLFSNDPCYDITIFSKKNHNYGWGIKYKKGFEVWHFAENAHKGCSENIIYPRYPKK